MKTKFVMYVYNEGKVPVQHAQIALKQHEKLLFTGTTNERGLVEAIIRHDDENDIDVTIRMMGFHSIKRRYPILIMERTPGVITVSVELPYDVVLSGADE